MQKQKKGFWLFIFSLIPGAGEMYMGFKKQGISTMLLFWAIFAVGSYTGMDWIVMFVPVLWFYSFFNVHNLKSLSDEEFYSMEDNYIFHIDGLTGDLNVLLSKHRNASAIFLIILGISILWNNIVNFLEWILPYYISNVLESFAYHLPQMVIAVGIILAGIYILRNKKEKLIDEKEVTPKQKETWTWTPYHPYEGSGEKEPKETPVSKTDEPEPKPHAVSLVKTQVPKASEAEESTPVAVSEPKTDADTDVF